MLADLTYRDRPRALANVASLNTALSPEVQERLAALLETTADPDSVLHYLERLRQEKPPSFARLMRLPMGLPLLATVFANSRFLSEALVQHPDWLDELLISTTLNRLLNAADYRHKLENFLDRENQPLPLPLTLAQFRRRQLLRIFLRDALGLATLAETCEELSFLADAILEVTLRRIIRSLVERHGRPRYQNAAGAWRDCGFTVLALGKLGAFELNYSSDIDLMFLFTANGQTEGREPLSNKEFYKKAANIYTDLLSTYTAEGLCYRVDLRLRPDGRLGEVCLSLDGAKRYYETRARDWELQMLIKARVAAGDRVLGQALLDFVEPRIYSTTLDFSAVEAMSETRERINERLAAKRKSATQVDIKLTPGGIRDIEFLVQCLQRLHGGREAWVRHGGTLLALSRLRDKNLLSDSEYSHLVCAYQFLRNLEHRLQIYDDRQTHTLPARSEELEILARRMPAAQVGDEVSAAALQRQIQHQLEMVQVTYERVIHAQQPLYYSLTPTTPETIAPEKPAVEPASNIVRQLDQKAPELASALSHSGLRRGRKVFEQFLERLEPYPDLLEQLNTDPTLSGYAFDLFEHSPYLTEEFLRIPELLGQLIRLRHETPPDFSYEDWPERVSDPGELRRLYKREMVRIQGESLCVAPSVFKTLACMSDLADAAVAAAYRMAVEQTREKEHHEPQREMMVIALGRLGMREFDLASDADLLFVLPGQDQAEQQFWTKVAERMIDVLSSYTKDGMIFSVDTRLRPNGRLGTLVQTEANCKKYFATQAEAWEGIAYMKARAVAGPIAPATAFLNELQELDWRRYGQSGRSRKDLRAMRARLEKEQGEDLALKTGYGGYYDIDFALMYLRLKGGGMFFKVLNTPERIDIIEKMGHLDRADAEFLCQAATFYRAVDHGLRLYSGHSEGTLPTSAAALECLTSMVARWTGEREESLAEQLGEIQKRTREFFDRLFAD